MTNNRATQTRTKGAFTRVLKIWDGTIWDEGWYDNKGRFRVYRPDYPRAFAGGYALRAWVVWWLHHGEPHPKGTVLHHKNRIKADDRLENLEVIDHGEHSKLHHVIGNIELICENCQQPFEVTKRKFNARIKEGNPIRFCSQRCYHSFPRDDSFRQKLSNSLKAAYLEGRKATPQGRIHSEETRQKMRESQKKRRASEKGQ